MSLGRSDDFNLGSVRAGSASGRTEPAILDPMALFNSQDEADSDDHMCGDRAEETGSTTSGFDTSDGYPPLELRFPPEGTSPIPDSYVLAVGGAIIHLAGTETEFGESNPYCQPGTESSVDQNFSNPGEQTEQTLPVDPTHLQGDRLIDISHEESEDVTERITWDLTFVEAPDSDGDGLSDFLEAFKYRTDPNNPDTDGDGYSDGAEVSAGTDPLDPNSHPGAPSGGGSGGGGGQGGAGGAAPGGGAPSGGGPGAPGGAGPAASADLVLDCGRARFEYFYVTKESTGVKPGDRVCAVLVSNPVAQEMLDEAEGGFTALSGVFMSYFLEYYAMHFDHLSEEAAEAYVRHYVKKRLQPVNLASSLIKGLFPDLEDAFAETSAFVTIGKVAALAAVPMAAEFEADQIEEKGACVGFLMDLTPDHLSVSGNLVYNPTHVDNLDTDSSLTRMTTLERQQRHLRPDKFVRRDFSLTCGADGSALRDTPRDNAKLLSGATIKVIK